MPKRHLATDRETFNIISHSRWENIGPSAVFFNTIASFLLHHPPPPPPRVHGPLAPQPMEF
jgi:hypothetical protein